MKTASDTITPLVLPPYFPLVPSSVYLPSSPRTSQLLLSTYDHIREGRTLHPESGQVSQSFKHRPHPPRDWRPSKNSATHRSPLPWSTVKTRPSLASINYPDDYFLPGGSSRDLDKLAKRCAQRRHCSRADRNIANSVTFTVARRKSGRINQFTRVRSTPHEIPSHRHSYPFSMKRVQITRALNKPSIRFVRAGFVQRFSPFPSLSLSLFEN